MAKFNVGDRVMIRYWDDMATDENVDKVSGVIRFKGDSVTWFNESMKKVSGRQATIKSISPENRVELSNWSEGDGGLWVFKPWMLCLVKKAEQKKKITVAEIEKALGYGVEIIKEGK